MKINDVILLHCPDCGAVVKASKEVIETMEKFDLNENDIGVKCFECQSRCYYSLIRFIESHFYG